MSVRRCKNCVLCLWRVALARDQVRMNRARIFTMESRRARHQLARNTSANYQIESITGHYNMRLDLRAAVAFAFARVISPPKLQCRSPSADSQVSPETTNYRTTITIISNNKPKRKACSSSEINQRITNAIAAEFASRWRAIDKSHHFVSECLFYGATQSS